MPEDDEGQTLYVGSLTLSTDLYCSEVMRFDYKSVALSLESFQTDADGDVKDTFEVELHRVTAGFFDEYVSTARLDCNGSSWALWSNVGPGDYYFKFLKDDDGSTVSSNSLMAYSITEYQ